MSDIRTQLEWVRDVRKMRLAVVISRLDQPDKVVKTFHLTQLTEAEKYAERMRPSRITDTKEMEVIRWYVAKDVELKEAVAIIQQKTKHLVK